MNRGLHPAKRAWLWSDGIDMPQRALFCAAFRAAIAAGCDVTTAWPHVVSAQFHALSILGRRCGHAKCMNPAIGTWGDRYPACRNHMPKPRWHLSQGGWY